MNIADQLARQRNRDAAERTLMAWIRTCLSLISFGFGLDKIVAAINRRDAGGTAQAEVSVQLVAVGFIVTGVVAMLAANRQHGFALRRLLRDDFVYQEDASIASAVALMIAAIGAVALLLLALGALSR